MDLSATTSQDFALEHSITEVNEVVVTGVMRAVEQKRTPTPVSIIPKLVLIQSSSTNIVSAISKQPGISEVTTGSAISKPVIRGLGYNRVIVMHDNMRQEGQQWGDEHGIEIDEYSISRVEILKGPASLSYGSDAMAGVVNMISEPNFPDGKIQGSILTDYQTNNGLFGYSLQLGANLNGFIWNLRYSNKLAHAYKNPYDGYVLNSGFRENDFSGFLGLNKKWGYTHLALSAFHITVGIVEGERDSLTGNFVKPVKINDTSEYVTIATNEDLLSYHPGIPFQEVYHYRAAWNNNLILGSSSLKLTLGFQQNRRQEFGDIISPDQYELYFLLNTLNYNLQFVLPQKNKLHMSFGLGGMYQDSRNRGEEYLVPDYNLFDAGIYSMFGITLNKVDISGGLRYDKRFENAKDLYLSAENERIDTPESGSTHPFEAFSAEFSDVSGSIGATYQISGAVFAKLNVSHGFRAPNIAELGSNGVHEGTLRYETGNPDLNAESSWQLDWGFGFNTEHISSEIDMFVNNIDHFIFSHRLTSLSGGDSISEGYSVFKFVHGQALLYGGEAKLDIHIHPIDWLHFENTFSYVQSVQRNQPDSTRYLPFTPAPRLLSTLRADLPELGKWMKNFYFRIEADHFFEQDKYYEAFNTETGTPAYTLFNIGMGMDIIYKRNLLFSFYLTISNLTNLGYQNHLSRLKYGPENYATGRVGVFNMGRNIDMKLTIPFQFNLK